MRRLSIVSVLLMSVLFLVIAPAIAQDTITIVFYQRGYVEGGDAASIATDEAVAAFEERYPEIDVEIVGIPWTTEGSALLESALAAGTDINVFRVTNVDVIRYAREGVLSAIDPFLSEEDLEDIYPAGLEAVSDAGQTWAWPLWATTIPILANAEYFEQQGVEIPTVEEGWTWDEFVEAAKALTFVREDGVQVYGFDTSFDVDFVGVEPLYYIDGGRVRSEDGTTFVQNEAEGASALQKIADLALVHQVTPPDYGQAKQLTVRGYFKDTRTVAMFMEPPGFIPDLEAAEFPLAILPVPTGDSGEPVSTGGIGLYAVVDVEDDAVEAAAHEFGRWLTGAEVAEVVAGYQLAPSLRRSNTSYATDEKREIINTLVGANKFEFPFAIPAELKANYYAALQAVILGQQTAQEAMDAIAPEYQAALDEANAE